MDLQMQVKDCGTGAARNCRTFDLEWSSLWKAKCMAQQRRIKDFGSGATRHRRKRGLDCSSVWRAKCLDLQMKSRIPDLRQRDIAEHRCPRAAQRGKRNCLYLQTGTKEFGSETS